MDMLMLMLLKAVNRLLQMDLWSSTASTRENNESELRRHEDSAGSNYPKLGYQKGSMLR